MRGEHADPSESGAWVLGVRFVDDVNPCFSSKGGHLTGL